VCTTNLYRIDFSQRERKSIRPSEATSAIRAGLLVIAAAAFAFSMGNNWYSHDQQDFLVPRGGADWTIKDNTFFIEPFTQLGSESTTKNVIQEYLRGKPDKFCDDSNPDAEIPAYDYELHIKREGDAGVQVAADGAKKSSGSTNTDKHNRNNTCLSNPDVGIVQGIYEIGLWKSCYCKDTLGVQCSMFGSNYVMFNNKQRKCDTFNVARAMILMVGILSLFALILASALIGGLRRVKLHALSNTLCLLAALLGLISSILFGVLYPVRDLNKDFAIYLAGWILVFFAACLGAPVTSYYREVESAGQVVPLQPLAVGVAPVQQ